MAKAVQSIDFAASGLMRHRFMRALGASYQAFYLSLFPVAALLWLILPWVVPSFASPFGLGNFGGVVLAAVMLVAATTNMTLLSLPFAAYDAIPRRLVALVWFAIGACSFVVCVGGVIFVLIGIAQHVDRH